MSAESNSSSEDSRATTPEDSESLDAVASEDSENPDGASGARPNTEPDQSSWIGYGLAVVLVGTVALGVLRPFYPTASALALGAFLALFGAFVGLLAFRERGRGS